MKVNIEVESDAGDTYLIMFRFVGTEMGRYIVPRAALSETVLSIVGQLRDAVDKKTLGKEY